MSNISDKIRAALYHDNAVIFPDLMRGTVWSRADSGAFSKKMDDMHGTMRVGMFVEHMEEWFQRHPDATDEQVKASAKRIAAFIGSNLSFFKSLRKAFEADVPRTVNPGYWYPSRNPESHRPLKNT